MQLLLEYCDKGTLRGALEQGVFMGDLGLNYPAILDCAIDIARAMLHLHCNNVLHMDLKARNVLLASSGTEEKGVSCKVSDFGEERRVERSGVAGGDPCLQDKGGSSAHFLHHNAHPELILVIRVCIFNLCNIRIRDNRMGQQGAASQGGEPERFVCAKPKLPIGGGRRSSKLLQGDASLSLVCMLGG